MEPHRQTITDSLNGRRTLVIMAKAPKPGMVKTRLARNLPVFAVTALYRCLLNDTIALARALNGVEVAIMCPERDVEDLAREVRDTVPVVAQTGNGLAAALTSVFTHFGAADHKRIVAFSSDSPHLPASVLESAFDALQTYDLVVGPTLDGGYYLVGASRSHPSLFSSDGMGTADALETLLTQAHKLGLSVHRTDPFYDIDVAADLSQLAAELQRKPGKAPKTAKWLSEWGSARRANANEGCL